MRFLILIPALAAAACASHQPESPFNQPEPATAERCASAIQNAEDKTNAVDFNTDRKGEVRIYIGKARAQQAKGDFDKCIKFADKAVEMT